MAEGGTGRSRKPVQSSNLLDMESDMERICSQCHAVIEQGNLADWCPACGGALIERSILPAADQPVAAAAEVDHRGIVLPRRHALGGIITPQ